MTDLTPVQDFGGWWCKREDLADWVSPEYPSGSKVRQYTRMCDAAPITATALVGCSAHSAQQIYVAAAARRRGIRGVVYIPGREYRTAATAYAMFTMQAEVREIRPGYPSVYRAAAKKEADKIFKDGGQCVRWDSAGAVADAAAQVANLPWQVKRVVIPTGSGLTVAGVLAGLGGKGKENGLRPERIQVLAVCVSPLATRAGILEAARRAFDGPLPPLQVVRVRVPYEEAVVAKLPDGTPLDPYYAAKALPYIKPGDCFWPPGLRPVVSMPIECQKAHGGWVRAMEAKGALEELYEFVSRNKDSFAKIDPTCEARLVAAQRALHLRAVN